LPNGNFRYRSSFFEKVHLDNAEQNKVRAGALAFSWVRSRLMPASGTLAFLLALAGGFAAHYTLLTLGLIH